MAFPPAQFRLQLSEELENILDFWKKNSVDEKNGGFLGRRNYENKVVENANKGIILNTRILWTFSAAANVLQEEELRFHADRAYNYLEEYFRDPKFGGVYWELDALGNPVNKRKQIYAQAFAIYALSEYYDLTKIPQAKEWALSLFELIEHHSKDEVQNGYIEAFQEDWTRCKDMRLSDKDRNSSKTMNTHLHILEAYTSLAQTAGSTKVRQALENLIDLFLNQFYNPQNHHFRLFFDDQWVPEGKLISFGHDIEAIWLLIEAAKATGNHDLLKRVENIAVPVADALLKEAYSPGKGVVNERDEGSGKIDSDRHWWPQAEAMVGLHYAFAISGDKRFQNAIPDIWNFIRKHIIDHKNGEWFFRVDKKNKPYQEEDKLGMWKCPYHNSRALMVLLQAFREEKYSEKNSAKRNI